MESLHLFEEWEASMVPIHSTEHLELSFLDALFDPPRVELYLPPNNKNRRRRDVETNSLLTISDTKKPTLTITTDTNVAADPVSPTTPNTSIPPPIQGTTVPSQPPPPPPPPVVEGNVDSDPPSSIPNGPSTTAEIANLLQQTHPDPSTQKDPVKDAKEVLAHVSLVAPKVPQQNALTKPINHPREEVRAEGQGDGSGPLKKDQDKSMELEFLTSQRQGTKEDPEKSDGALSNTAFVATIVTPFAAVVVFLVALVGYRRHKFKRNSPP
ncbi:hypothetical protein HMI55_002699 [Coelomomyces lativittatus]|nr:hypothetical protein HMI55_002699 [Coelomomyces lativittatus]